MRKRIIEELKNVPKLGLNDLLKKRKITLKRFIDEFGITTYESLQTRCSRIGVKPPPYEDFAKIFAIEDAVSNPQEGVVVVETSIVIDEATGHEISPIEPESNNVDIPIQQKEDLDPGSGGVDQSHTDGLELDISKTGFHTPDKIITYHNQGRNHKKKQR